MATSRISPAARGPTRSGAPTLSSATFNGLQPSASLSPAERYAAAAERLDSIGILLHGLHRRHKNQHRVSTYWWPAFGQLRRHVRKLDGEVRAVLAEKTPNKFDKETETFRRAIAHARDVRDQFVPKVYLAFSRLVADRRHAQLGLLLMGILAQVHTTLRQITGDVATDRASRDGDEMDDDAAPKTAAGGLLFIKDDNKNDDGNSRDNDLGEIVARDDDTDDERAAETKKQTTAAKATAKLPLATGAQPTKKRTRPEEYDDGNGDNDSSSTFDPSTKTTKIRASDETPARPEKKKLKTEENGVVPRPKEAPSIRDEAKKEKKEKRDKKDKGKEKDKDKDKTKKTKKRKKNGDEFDDLFSGLL